MRYVYVNAGFLSHAEADELATVNGVLVGSSIGTSFFKQNENNVNYLFGYPIK